MCRFSEKALTHSKQTFLNKRILVSQITFHNSRHNMKQFRILILVCATMFSLSTNAQFRQDHAKVDYMFKAELGYLPFVDNLGDKGEYGYIINDMQHAVNVNVINGININQDFFLGLGLGYNFVAKPKDIGNLNIDQGSHCPMAFLDFDFRPLNEEWAPMFEAKIGASYLMSDGPYDNTLKPYIELATGVNWFFNHEVRNMERNYKSLYMTIAFAYTQQACYVPIRIGFRF